MISSEAFEKAENQAEKLVEQMTVPELCSQLLHSSREIFHLGIPAYNWWNEGLHGAARSGTATVFPQAIGLAAMFDTSMMLKIGDIIATEQRAKFNTFSAINDRGIYKGVTVWSPNINIFRDPRWGRGQETYGEDPYLTSCLAVAFIRGLQGNDNKWLKTAACVKHFVAHSGPESERHHFNSIVSEKDLEETYFPAFEAAVKEADVNGVMGAYSEINGEPCCATHLIADKLRVEWGFRGIFISDCWAIRDFHEQHHYTDSPEESSAVAIKNGCDLNCGCTYNYLEKAFSKKLLTKEDLKKSVIRVLTTRILTGQFDHTPYDSIGFDSICTDEHHFVSLQAARESLVLLKNDGLLPLDKTQIKSLAIIGPNADSRKALWGNYHGTSMCYTTVLDGFRKLVNEDIRIFYSEGSSLNADKVERLGENDDRLSEAISSAKMSDAVILCLGLDESIEGEMHDDGNGGIAGDRKDIGLLPCQKRLLQAVGQTEKPIILVLFSGGGIDPEIDDIPSVKAVIQAWYPGEFGGEAIAEMIMGLINPSGKLPITFYRRSSRLPDFSSYSMKDRTYRYYNGEPLFPFGHGLSYTRFAYSNPLFNASDNSVTFTLSNVGELDGDEISFVWCRTESKDFPVNPKLCGFTRSHIKAGDQKMVTIKLDERFMTLVSDDGKRYVQHGKWHIYIAGSQIDQYSLSLSGSNVLAVNIDI